MNFSIVGKCFRQFTTLIKFMSNGSVSRNYPKSVNIIPCKSSTCYLVNFSDGKQGAKRLILIHNTLGPGYLPPKNNNNKAGFGNGN